MRMSYTYGAEDPYKLVLMPISKPAPFVEAQVAWEVMDEHNYLDLPIPQALKPIYGMSLDTIATSEPIKTRTLSKRLSITLMMLPKVMRPVT